MSKPIAATDYLSKPQKIRPRPVCVVLGDDAFLKREVLHVLRAAVLGGEDAEFSLSTVEGRSATLGDVLDELATVAMFGGDRRMVVVEAADEFISRYRAELEDYVAAPSASGILVLEVKSLPANTRLYKAVAAEGLLIDASAPQPAKLPKWLVGWAQSRHQARLSAAAAELLVEAVGSELGLLDQEIARVALLGTDRQITPELVRQHVGGWRTQTTWEMLDAAMAGNVAAALGQLDRLLGAGEQPIGLLGQIGFSLRRLAATTRIVLNAEHEGRRVPLRQALERAGVKPFLIKKLEGQLRRLGRHRGSQLYDWLLQADMDLKGASPAPPQIILERLIVRVAAPVGMIDPRKKEGTAPR